jgi:membrane-bound ClpP family serine protease
MADTTQRMSDRDAAEERARTEREASGARNLFDLRTIIGGLFTVYGIMLTIMGLLDSAAEVEKAAGIRINLWTGLGMLVLGLGFLLWQRLRPLTVDEIVEATSGTAREGAGGDEPSGSRAAGAH